MYQSELHHEAWNSRESRIRLSQILLSSRVLFDSTEVALQNRSLDIRFLKQGRLFMDQGKRLGDIQEMLQQVKASLQERKDSLSSINSVSLNHSG